MRSNINHPLFARFYPRVCAFADAQGQAAFREELLTDARGRVLEIGAGHGANFPYYPATVDAVIALEPEPRLRTLAARAAARTPVSVHLVAGRAEQLPFPDGAFDGVVASLVLCSLPDVSRALREAGRVLAPGGRLYFLEHVRSEQRGFARMQRALDLVWPMQGGGCHLARRTEAAISQAGFEIEHARHFEFLIRGRRTPSSPCVIGTATRP